MPFFIADDAATVFLFAVRVHDQLMVNGVPAGLIEQTGKIFDMDFGVDFVAEKIPDRLDYNSRYHPVILHGYVFLFNFRLSTFLNTEFNEVCCVF